MSTDYSLTQAVLLLAVAVFVYFIPNWVALARKHHNSDAIFITNLLLGWTALGWIAALIWAFTEVKPKGANAPEIQSMPAQPEPSGSNSNEERYDALIKAKELRDEGILTEQEFQEEKKRILAHTGSITRKGP